MGGPFDLAFSITTSDAGVDMTKWSQPQAPYIPQGALFNGWNERSSQLLNGTDFQIVADDWICTNNQPITDIHWWGSFLGWSQSNLPPMVPEMFAIEFWTDMPAGPNSEYSHPDLYLNGLSCSINDPHFSCSFVGWDIDPRGISPPEACFEFNYILPQPWEQPLPGSNVYWMSIVASYNMETQFPWGWKTRPHFAMDDAVRIFNLPPSDPSNCEPIEYPSGVSWDTAFALTTASHSNCVTMYCPNSVLVTCTPTNGAYVCVQCLCQQLLHRRARADSLHASIRQLVLPWQYAGLLHKLLSDDKSPVDQLVLLQRNCAAGYKPAFNPVSAELHQFRRSRPVLEEQCDLPGFTQG